MNQLYSPSPPCPSVSSLHLLRRTTLCPAGPALHGVRVDTSSQGRPDCSTEGNKALRRREGYGGGGKRGEPWEKGREDGDPQGCG